MFRSNSYVDKVVVSINNKKFDIYGDQGEHEIVQCDSEEQFFNCLKMVKQFLKQGDFYQVEYTSEFLT